MTRLLLLGLLALTLPLAAQDKDVPTQATDEIARRGDLVEHVDGFQSENNPVDAIADALAVPQDDSNKWHITLVSTRGCASCERLKKDFESSPVLQSWVNVADYKKSWAHYQVIDIADPTQAWRWKDFKPTAFPTLIVQPPYDASWGDPHTVVYLKTGYDGKPDALAASMRGALEKYAVKMFPRHLAKEQAVAPQEGHGQSPPFVLPGPQQPQPSPAYPYPQIPPPEPTAIPGLPFGGLLLNLLVSFLGTSAGLALVMAVLRMLGPKVAASPNKLDDLALAYVQKILEGKINPPPPPAP